MLFFLLISLCFQLLDSFPPKIRLISKTSCAGFLKRKKCDQRVWSTRVEILDEGLGLKSVWTEPATNIRTPLIPGTPYVQFVYENQCCEPQVTIFATDLASNRNALFVSVGDVGENMLERKWIIIKSDTNSCFRIGNWFNHRYRYRRIPITSASIIAPLLLHTIMQKRSGIEGICCKTGQSIGKCRNFSCCNCRSCCSSWGQI